MQYHMQLQLQYHHNYSNDLLWMHAGEETSISAVLLQPTFLASHELRQHPGRIEASAGDARLAYPTALYAAALLLLG